MKKNKKNKLLYGMVCSMLVITAVPLLATEYDAVYQVSSLALKNSIIYYNVAGYPTDIHTMASTNISYVGADKNLVDTDPSFISVTDYNITPSSAAYNLGDNVFNISDKDVAGNTRTQATIEIGPYEMSMTTYTTAQAGNWNTPATWTGGVVPTDGNIIQILHNVSIDANVAPFLVQVSAGKQLTLNASQTLTVNTLELQGDQTNGTATYVDNGTTTTSNVKMQQYFAPSRNWYISSPIVSLNKQYFAPVVASTDANIYFCKDCNNNFSVQNTYYTLFNTAQGYVLQGNGTGGVVTLEGTNFYTGNQTTGGLYATQASKKGMNLIGNPYPSYVSWKSIVDAGRATNLGWNDGVTVNYTIYYRTKVGGTYYFETYNPALDDGINPASVYATNNSGVGYVDRYIPPMQAFWIRVRAAQTGSVTFANADRSHKDQTATKDRLRAPGTSNTKVLCLKVSNGVNGDVAAIAFNANASNGFEQYDSPKMSNEKVSIPEIYTLASGEKMVINALQNVESNSVLPLGFTTGESNTFTIKATEVVNFDANTEIVLVDKLLNKETKLEADAQYSFTSAPTTTDSRFAVEFRAVAEVPIVVTPTVIPVTETLPAPIAYVLDGKKIMVKTNAEDEGVVTVSNAFGQVVATATIDGATTTINKELIAGIYVVAVQVAGKTSTQKVVIN